MFDRMLYVGKSRFRVSPVSERTIDGKVFASRRESLRYCDLKLLETAGVISSLECQPSFEILINGKQFCLYTADFKYVITATDKVMIEDVKSTGTAKDASYRLRKKAAELYCGITVSEVLS